jgi:spore maturation protein CgeB
MVKAGYSPSVRLFEAAGCGTTIVSDRWAGIEAFFTPGEEILLAASPDDIGQYVVGLSDEQVRRIGRRAQERVLEEHSSERRAMEFERYAGNGLPRPQSA